MKNPIVVKSNDLINASYKLSMSEQRVILACISKIKPNTEIKDLRFEVTAQELANLSQINMSKAYQSLKESVERLAERWIIVDIPDPKNKYSKYKTRWISGIAYENEGSIRLTFAYDVLPFLSQLHGQFTQYSLLNVSKFSSVYAIRLYELMMQWKNKNMIEVGLDDFKEKLQIKEEYSRIFDLKKYVIEPAVKQINQHSDFWINYDQKKRGRKITHFVFSFGKKKSALKQLPPLPNPDLEMPEYNAMIAISIPKNKASTFLKQYGTKYIAEKLQVLRERQQIEEVASPSGFFIKALEENWISKLSEQHKIEEEQKKNQEKQEQKKLIKKEKEEEINKKLDLFFDSLNPIQQNHILEEYKNSSKFFGLSDKIEHDIFGLNSERSKTNFRYFLLSKKDAYQIF